MAVGEEGTDPTPCITLDARMVRQFPEEARVPCTVKCFGEVQEDDRSETIKRGVTIKAPTDSV
jgi:hypothetical protein